MDSEAKQTKQVLAELTARIANLEKAQQTSAPTQDVDAAQFWALDHLQKASVRGGIVMYAGVATTPTGAHYRWQREVATKEIFNTQWDSLDAVLVALGHPVRLRLLKALLDGQRTKAALEALDGIGTTGQLYHHLKKLEDGGWVRSLQRGVYDVPGERVIPLLAILSAAMG